MLNHMPTAQVLDTACTQPTPWASATRGISSLALHLPNLGGTAVGNQSQSLESAQVPACLGLSFPKGILGKSPCLMGLGSGGCIQTRTTQTAVPNGPQGGAPRLVQS